MKAARTALETRITPPALPRKTGGKPEIADDPTALQAVLEDIKSEAETMQRGEESATPDFVLTAIANMRTETVQEMGDIRTEMGNMRAETAREMGDIRTEMGNMRAEIAREMGDMRAEMGNMRAEIASEMGGMRTEIANMRMDIVREMGRMRVETVQEISRLDVKIEQKHNRVVQWVVWTVIAVSGLLFTAIRFFA